VDALTAALWEQGEAIFRLIAAAALGGMVGLERERSGKPAGFRTHLLICVGAALLTELSIDLARSATAPGGFRADPGRIAAQIVSGVGFLGAGTILHSRGSVVGLTTAASMWVVAAIGMATGAGSYVTALATALLVVLALRLLGRLEARVEGGARAVRRMEIEFHGDPAVLADLERTVAAAGPHIELADVHAAGAGFVASYHARGSRQGWDAAVRDLLARPGVRRVSLQ
jgi:putative Mg2+ transporter-C (MgtC) family protein